MYPSETAWFIKEYEEAVRRPYGYLFVDLKPTTPDRRRLRTNVLPGQERFDKGFEENRVSQELLQYLRQQTLMMPPQISEMQRIQNNVDNLLYRTNLEEDQKAKQYMQLQNKFLNYKNQLKSLIPEATIPTRPKESNQTSTNVQTTGEVPTAPNAVQEPPKIKTATPVQAPTQVTTPQALSTMATSSSISPPSLPPSVLTPPPTVESLSPVRKLKRPQSVKFVNYLDYEPKKATRRSRRLHRTSPYKHSNYDEDDWFGDKHFVVVLILVYDSFQISVYYFCIHY